MDNQELELRIKEILSIENFFDMVEATIAFEKEYKTTNFFKKTKMPLIEVIKGSKAWYCLQLENIVSSIQKAINDLDLGKINNILEDLGNVFGQENEEIMSAITRFGAIVK